MERDPRWPTGEWNGFYLEPHQPKKGWMHLYLSFDQGTIAGEGTDYVGPWTVRGSYDRDSGACSWVKQYLGKHQVVYRGIAGQQGIQGHWNIGSVADDFHIWPKFMGNINELYLRNEFDLPAPSIPLGTVPAEPVFV
jgi:hypothetical protein